MLVRGAWIALDGRKPAFADLAALNGPAIWRLFSSQLVLALLLLPIALIVIGIALTAAETIQPAARLLNLSFTSDLSDPQQGGSAQSGPSGAMRGPEDLRSKDTIE